MSVVALVIALSLLMRVVMCVCVGVCDVSFDTYDDMWVCCIYGGVWVSASSAILREVAPILLRPNVNDDKESERELSAGSTLMDDPTEFPSACDFDTPDLPPFGLRVFIFIMSPRDLSSVAF